MGLKVRMAHKNEHFGSNFTRLCRLGGSMTNYGENR
jgi:hypothetical protein